MGLFKPRGKRTSADQRAADRRAEAHLQEWAGTRRGVEAFVEPPTYVTQTTVVLIALDGEWTRRRIAGPQVARDLGKRLGIPVYDVGLVGYPRRMREYNARQQPRRFPPGEATG